MSEYKLPLPNPGFDDKQFWEGCKRHELLLQECKGCGHHRYWNEPMCPKCNSFDSEAVKASGRGTIWSFTTTQHGFSPPFKDVVPYTVAIVQLEEGPRLTTNLVGCSEEEVRIGMPVEVVFDDVSPEVSLPKFRPAS